MDLAWQSVSELKAQLDAGDLTSVALTERMLSRIAQQDGAIGAFLALNEDGALAQAGQIDRRRKAGEKLGPLAGIPIGIKDMICTKGLATTAASKILDGFVPPYDATVVERLRQADAIILGKLNQDEFAMGSSNENSAFKPCRNPWNHEHVPGGSSGGSAAAVASGLCPISLGTDTGGSIRQPASFCGVVGIKPTYGRVSRYGVVAFASSLDQVGPLGRSVDDVASVLEVIAGHDPRDSSSIPEPMPSLTGQLRGDIAGVKVGVPQEYFVEAVDTQVQHAVRESLSVLEAQGAELVPITLPHTEYAVATYYILATAEASSNLARYDGVRYGHRTEAPCGHISELYSKSRAEGFGPEVIRRIMLGSFVLSAGFYDAYYLKAQKVRTLIRRDFQQAFTQCDVIAAPTSPVTAFKSGEHVEDPLKMYLMDILTIPASLAGLPCLSQPCGFDDRKLPIGWQLMGPPLEEARILNVAKAYENQTAWHKSRPGEATDG
jgi:aspartyl-tRNA(Asn)/glutamyl-tRNA(Gln) amidotransferase subunit A